MKAQGLNTGFSDDIQSLTTLVQPNVVNSLTVPQQVKQERNNSAPNLQFSHQEIPTTVSTTLNLEDIMDDSSSGLSADPMLSSHPVSPNMDEDSMDYGLWET